MCVCVCVCVCVHSPSVETADISYRLWILTTGVLSRYPLLQHHKDVGFARNVSGLGPLLVVGVARPSPKEQSNSKVKGIDLYLWPRLYT